MEKIKYSQLQDPTLIENKYCKVFENLHFESADIEVLEYIKFLNNLPNTTVDDFISHVKEGKLTIGDESDDVLKYVIACYNNIKARFSFELKEYKVLSLLIYICGNIGKLMMYCVYIQYKLKELNERELTFRIFNENIFPFGYPTDNDLDNLWESCKIDKEGNSGSDNLIDYQSAMKSIHFI